MSAAVATVFGRAASASAAQVAPTSTTTTQAPTTTVLPTTTTTFPPSTTTTAPTKASASTTETASTDTYVLTTDVRLATGNVKHYGAVGDGIADDTAAIQATIDAAYLVYFPAGTYKCESTLHLSLIHI